MSTGPRPGSNPLAGLFDSLRGNRTRLVLTSGTLLFVELLLIRWIPSEVRYIGFFSNFLLMASFLGIGHRDPAGPAADARHDRDLPASCSRSSCG